MFKKLRNKAVISFCIFLLLVVGGTSLTYYLFAEDLYVAKKKKVMNEAFQALQTIEKLGCARILTSGQSNSAETGLPLLKELVARARNVIIMPGCGVNAANVRKIAESTGAFEFHLSARIRLGSDMVYRNPAVSMGGTVQVDEYGREVSSSEKVEEVIRRLVY